MTLVDVAAEFAFAGDFLTPGPLAEFLPGGGMGDYLQGVEALLRTAPEDTRVFGAHPDLPEVGGPPSSGAPELTIGAARDLRTTLLAIRGGTLGGTGFYPVIYPVNERVELWANPPWLQDWGGFGSGNYSSPRAVRRSIKVTGLLPLLSHSE